MTTSINPSLHPRQELTRRERSIEVLSDQGVTRALQFGREMYTDSLKKAAKQSATEGYKENPAETLKNLDYLVRSVESGLVKGLRRVAESMYEFQDGKRVSRVTWDLLGNPSTLGNRKELEFAAKVSTNTSKEMLIDQGRTGGNTPDELIDYEPIQLLILTKDVEYVEGEKVISDSTGIRMVIDEKGQIRSVNGMTYKHGVPHYTSDFLEDNPDVISELQVNPDTLDSIYALVDDG
jgi:hypothetical protein